MEGENQSLLHHASFSCGPTCKPVPTNQAGETCISACLDTCTGVNPSVATGGFLSASLCCG